MKKRWISLLLILWGGLVFGSSTESTGIYSGQMRVLPCDYAFGIRTYTNASGNYESRTNRYVGAVVDLVRLSIRGKLSDTVSIQVDPSFRANVKSMPEFGSDIGNQLGTSAQLFDIQSFETAKLIIKLPDGYVLSSGLMRNKLTWDYGDFMAEKTSLMETKFSVSSNGVINDAGIELNKTVSLYDMEIPMTLQLLNGANNIVDLNQHLAWLVRAEPSFFGIKFLGSYFYNMTPSMNQDVRYAVGAEFSTGSVYVRAEYVSGTQEASRTVKNGSTADGSWTYDSRKTTGYVALIKYGLMENLNIIGNYSVLEMNHFNGVAYQSDAKEVDTDIVLSLEYAFTSDVAFIGSYEVSTYVRTCTPVIKALGEYNEKLDFSRIIVGSRLRF